MGRKLVGDELIRFIVFYRERECLWNTNNKSYKNIIARTECYEELSREFSLSIADVKKKINNVRSTYLSEMKRVRQSKLNETDPNKIYKPKVYWFKYLNFIKDFVTPRTSNSNPNDDDNNSILQSDDNSSFIVRSVKRSPPPISDPFEDNSNLTEYLTFTEPTEMNDDAEHLPSNCNEASTGERKPTKKRKREYVNDGNNGPDVDTSVDDYCKSLAGQMKQLPKREIIILQMEMQNLVSQKLLEYLDSNESQSND